MVPPHVGDKVEPANHRPADESRGVVESAANESKAKIGESNVEGLAGAEDGAGGLKVALTEPALLVALLAVLAGGDVEHHVHLPAGELVGNELDEVDNGGVLDNLRVEEEGVDAGPAVLLGGGYKDHVLFHVASEAVVAVVLANELAFIVFRLFFFPLAMRACVLAVRLASRRIDTKEKKRRGQGTYRKLPGKVRNTKSRVQSPANKVIEARMDGKGAVASLVGEDPETSADETLGPAVNHPRRIASNGVLNGRDVGDGEVDEAGSEDQVAGHVGERAGGRGDEAVLGDGIANGLDVGELDLFRLFGGGGGREGLGGLEMELLVLYSFSCVMIDLLQWLLLLLQNAYKRHTVIGWTLKFFFPFPFLVPGGVHVCRSTYRLAALDRSLRSSNRRHCCRFAV